MSSAVCAACQRGIDAAAKVCPYCGANPQSGERVDTQALLEQIFRPKDVTPSESVIEYARQRQGIVIGVSVAIVFILLVIAHQFVTRRNATEVTDAPPVPLTEVADLSKLDQTQPVALPQLDFLYEGRPHAMRTYIVERGAVAPAPPPAATTTAAPAAARPAPPPQTAAPRPPQSR